MADSIPLHQHMDIQMCVQQGSRQDMDTLPPGSPPGVLVTDTDYQLDLSSCLLTPITLNAFFFFFLCVIYNRDESKYDKCVTIMGKPKYSMVGKVCQGLRFPNQHKEDHHFKAFAHILFQIVIFDKFGK